MATEIDKLLSELCNIIHEEERFAIFCEQGIATDKDLDALCDNLGLKAQNNQDAIDEIAKIKDSVMKDIKREAYGYRSESKAIYDIDGLLNKLQELKHQSRHKGSTLIYINEIYASNEYLHISNVELDEDGDCLIEDNLKP